MNKILLVILFLSTISCSPATNYAVLIWSPNDWSETELYQVLNEKFEGGGPYLELQNSKGERLWVEAWRVEVTDSLETAKKLAERPTVRFRTIALGARLWSKPDPYSTIVNPLGKDIQVRVLSEIPRDERSSVVWLEVISQDGFRGFIPRYMLGDLREPTQVITLASILDKAPWRPAEFENMLKSNRISIEILNSDLGLRINPEEGTLFIGTITPSLDLVEESFKFGSISEYADSQGEFLVQGPVQIRLKSISANRLRVIIPRYEVETWYEFLSFQDRTQDEIITIISAERAKRQDYLNNLTNIATNWTSDAYGSLSIDREGKFIWTGPERLIPYLKIFYEAEVERLESATAPNSSNEAVGDYEPDYSLLDMYRPWFGSVTHGGYEVPDGASHQWEGYIEFGFYAPLPPKTNPLVPNSGFPLGVYFHLYGNESSHPLSFAVGLDQSSGVTKGLVLIPIPSLELTKEGKVIDTLPEAPVVMYFVPNNLSGE